MQPVSTAAQEQTLGGAYAGVVRKRGLRLKGLRIHERVTPADAHLEVDGITVEIADVNLAATEAFTTLPSIEAFLAADVSDSGTTLTVNDSAILVDGYYTIGSEVVQVTARPTGTTVTVTRARWGTTAVKHFASDGVESTNPAITDKPVLMGNRRASLYLYGAGDSMQGDGTLRYRGVVVGEPQISEDLATWRIQIDPLTSLLDNAELAGKTDEPIHAGGIYYAWSGAISITVVKATGTTSTSGVDATYTWEFTGRFATQADFCDSLTASFDTNVGTGSIRVSAVEHGAGWRVRVAQPAADARYAWVRLSSSVDGRTISETLYGPDDSDGSDGPPLFAVSTNGQYYVHWDSAIDAPISEHFTPRAVPRASYGIIAPGGEVLGTTDASATSSAPNTRLYLERTDLVTANDYIAREDVGGEEDAAAITWQISSVTAASGYVTVTSTSSALSASLAYAVGPETEFQVARWYGIGSVEDFRSNLVSKAIESDSGSSPFITSSDFPSWATTVTEAATGRAFLLRRHYVFSKPIKLRDLLEAEWRLLGVYPYVTSTGTVLLRRIGTPTPTESATYTVDAEHQVINGGNFGQLVVNPDGATNVVTIRTGYDRVEDKHRGRTYSVRNPRSIGRLHGKRAELAIAPKVKAETEPDHIDAQMVAQGVMAMFGDRYETVTLQVPRTAFGLVLGDTCRLQLNHVPYNGGRGIDKRGLVIERDWDLSEPVGTITVLYSALNIRGYAPSARIDSQANVSGNTWDITLDSGVYGSTTSVFAVNDRIRIIEYDAGTPAVLDGTIDTISSASDMRVTLTSAWTPGTSIWDICYGTAANVAAGANETSQAQYAFCGGSDGRVTDLTGDPSASVFSP